MPPHLYFVLAAMLAPSSSPSDVEWNARTAEHLLNRAGFGAPPEEIAEAVERGLDATVDALITTMPASDDDGNDDTPTLRPGFELPPVLIGGPETAPPAPANRLALRPGYYRADGGEFRELAELREYCREWIAGMIRGDDPLRDRMTIFWHGHFVSSFDELGVSELLVQQLEFLRENALGDLDTLVRGIARDPAMLAYLNNDLNVKESPNENWARELMELFTLGVGNYTEDDIKQAALAFSGWTSHEGEFVFRHEQHAYGPKTVLGVTGDLGGEDVIDILLARDACGRFLARKLIAYFEGVEPTPERVERYADLLHAEELRFDRFLGTLFRDPEFYRDEVTGTRVAAPVEYFVGVSRRLGIEPPADMLYVVASMAGQRLGAPPNVKGWEEGFAWISTGGVMQRSNFVGLLLGKYDDAFDPRAIMMSRVESQGREFNGPYRDFLAMAAWLAGGGWEPELDVPTEGESDEEIVSRLLERLLAVPVSSDVDAEVEQALAALRAGDAAETVVRDLVHVVLSLPEAQLL